MRWLVNRLLSAFVILAAGTTFVLWKRMNELVEEVELELIRLKATDIAERLAALEEYAGAHEERDESDDVPLLLDVPQSDGD